jgi:putative colanic acid biosynthesis acetyltransferase WcaB
VDIGVNAVILGPITIGNAVVIGAGSVVIRDVEPGSVMAGSPARLIRRIHPSGM